MTATLILARLTLMRVLRGRAVWVSAVIACFPALFALITRSQLGDVADQLVVFEQLLLAIIPPMFVAASLGEEIEDRTTTYLWSRPLPRWSVLAGKLLALVPLVMVLAVGSWWLAVTLGNGTPTGRSLLGMAGSAVSISVIAAGLALLVPKHGMALTICYLLFFDLPIGALPASLQALSVSYQTRVLCGYADGTVASALIALGVITGIWGGIALWRLRRLEA